MRISTFCTALRVKRAWMGTMARSGAVLGGGQLRLHGELFRNSDETIKLFSLLNWISRPGLRVIIMEIATCNLNPKFCFDCNLFCRKTQLTSRLQSIQGATDYQILQKERVCRVADSNGCATCNLLYALLLDKRRNLLFYSSHQTGNCSICDITLACVNR